MKKLALYIDYDYDGTGVAQYIKALLSSLVELHSNDITITVIYTKKSWDNLLNKIINIESIYVINSKYRNIFYQILIAVRLYRVAKFISRNFDKNIKFIDRQNFDIIIFPGADTIACLVRSRVLGTIHDLMHRYERHFKECGSFLRYHYRDNYYRMLLKLAIGVFVDSNLGKKQALESYSTVNSKIFILPFVAPDHVYDGNTDSNTISIRKQFEKKYLFYAAMFKPHKNHMNLLEAIKILKDRGYVIDLLLAGRKNHEYNNLYNYVLNNDLDEQVKFLGYVSDNDIANLYQNAFAMVMPTFLGPTNIPPIEAILLNCPPLVSNRYAMPEQFEDAALYFDPHSAVQIADTIELLLNDKNLRDNLINNGIKIRDKFSKKRFQADLVNAILNI